MLSIPEGNGGENPKESKQGCGFGQGLSLSFGKSAGNMLGLLLIVLGVGMALIPLVMCLQGVYGQRELERRWQAAVSSRPAEKHQPTKAPAPSEPSTAELHESGPAWHAEARFPITRLAIEKISMEAVVVEGIAPSALRRGPGHFPGTAGPGEDGNCCIAGHRNMYGSWFRRLDRLSAGDHIVLRTPDMKFVYMVTDKFEVLPTDVSVLEQTSEPTLTLVTCTPVPRPTHRLIVVANLVERYAPGR